MKGMHYILANDVTSSVIVIVVYNGSDRGP